MEGGGAGPSEHGRFIVLSSPPPLPWLPELSMLRPVVLLSTLLLAACASAPPLAAPCSGNCRTHEEGYQWAQSVDLRDPRGCIGESEDFVDGCRDSVDDYRQIRARKEGL